MDYCNGGDLEDLLAKRLRFTEKEARHILSQIVQGYKSIIKEKVVHRDLKLANILIHFENKSEEETLGNRKNFQLWKYTCPLTENIKIVIADLGFAKQITSEYMAETQCGTPLFMAPEVLQGKEYGRKVDVWSIGTIFYEMLTGFVPFTGRNQMDLVRNLEKGNYLFPKAVNLSLEGLHFLN